MIVAFFVWLSIALLFLIVFNSTRDWESTSNLVTLPTIDREQVLKNRIAQLDLEISEMSGVLIEYNNRETWAAYWELVGEKAQAEVELQTKYGYSRKVTNSGVGFRRV